MADDDAPSAAQLTHLEQLPIDVSRVLSGGIAMVEVVRGLAVRTDLVSALLLVTQELGHLGHVEQLDRQ